MNTQTTALNEKNISVKKNRIIYTKPQILAVSQKGELASAKCKDKPGVWCKGFW